MENQSCSNLSMYLKDESMILNGIFPCNLKSGSKAPDAKLFTTVVKIKAYYNISLGKAAYDFLSGLSSNQLDKVYQDIQEYAEKVQRIFSGKTFYQGFPFTVEKSSKGLLDMNSFLYYSGLIDKPLQLEDKDDVERAMSYDARGALSLKPIIKIESFKNDTDTLTALIDHIITSPVAINEVDKQTLEQVFSYKASLQAIRKWLKLGKDMPIHANRVVAVGSVIKQAQNTPVAMYILSGFNGLILDTATDILRLAYYLGTGSADIVKGSSLNLTTKEKKSIFNLFSQLDKVNDDDFVRYAEQWKLLDKVSQVKKPANFKQYIDGLYNHEIRSWDSYFNEGLTFPNYAIITKCLEQQPASFLRRFLELPFHFNYDTIVSWLDSIDFSKLETKTLVSLANRMFNLNSDTGRIISVKGQSVYLPENPSYQGNEEVDNASNTLYEYCNHELEKRAYNVAYDYFKASNANDNNEAFGHYVMNPNYLLAIPSSLRESNQHYNFITPRSKIMLDDQHQNDRYLRLLTYWENAKSKDGFGITTDVDLSAVMYDENFEPVGHIAFTNIKNGYAQHSGDLTDASEGAVEAIDVDLQQAWEHGVRYISMLDYVYSEQTFKDIGTVSAGFLTYSNREEMPSLKTKQAEQLFQISSDTRNALTMIFDVEHRQFIVCDQNNHGTIKGPNAVLGNEGYTAKLVQNFVTYRPYYLPNRYKVGDGDTACVLDGYDSKRNYTLVKSLLEAKSN